MDEGVALFDLGSCDLLQIQKDLRGPKTCTCAKQRLGYLLKTPPFLRGSVSPTLMSEGDSHV